MKILLISASHRAESLNQQLAGEVERLLKKQQLSITHPLYESLNLPIFNAEHAEKNQLPEELPFIKELIEKHDAVIITAPEYNWSYPASLKNIIDWVSTLRPYVLHKKPILLMSATPSPRGGVMCTEHLKSPLEGLGCHLFSESFNLGNANEAFNIEDKHLNEKDSRALKKTLTEFCAYATDMLK